MKRNLLILLIAAMFLSCSGMGRTVFAGESDIMINLLVKKGILTQEEAAQVLESIKDELVREKNAVKEVAAETAKQVAGKEIKAGAVDIPKWVKKLKLKGDLRLRYQYQETKNDNAASRDRARMRFRIGAEAQVNDQWLAGFGLATGGTDPRSTNQTFTDTFETPDVRMDYAFTKYTPSKYATIIGGKFKNPFWGTKDLLWDGDIRPEGVVVSLDHKMSPKLGVFANLGYLILEEFGATNDDPYVWVLQPGIKAGFGDAYFKVAPSYYCFSHLKGNDLDEHGANTNSTDAADNLLYDYDSIGLDAELGFNLKNGPIPFVALFGQYISALDSDKDLDKDGNDDDTGCLVGLKFGHKKTKKFGQWQAKYNYRRLERDAWPDFLPDSDFYGGATDAKGHEFEFKLGLAKNVSLGLDYYKAKRIRTNTNRDQDLVQVDMLVKW